MDTTSIKQLNDAHIINTYGSRRLAIARGEGARLWDAEGSEYLDFFAGIAVVALGHCHPHVTEAIRRQAGTLVHVSNLYYTEPQVCLAERLSTASFAERWFFCNCGATAAEAAIKLARRYWHVKVSPKPQIISAEQSFHGRTIGALTATGQPKYHEGFGPMLPGFTYVPYNDVDALASAIGPQTGAVMLEPIQGEGGVRVPADDYLAKARALCDERGGLLILDEVQTGMGRTGRLFAHQHAGIAPDIMTLAKALANGVPMGAVGCSEEVSQGFAPGSHASTFGGNPLSAAAALATLDIMLAPGFLDRVQEMGAYMLGGLRELARRHDAIVDVRGKGLMVGVEMRDPVKPVVDALLDRGIIAGPAGPHVLRFLPPLIVGRPEIDRVLETLGNIL